MRAVRVVGGALLLRALPILAGLAVARTYGDRAYADFVLLLSFLNLAASVIQLGLIPQILSSPLHTESGRFVAKLAVIGSVVFAICAYLLAGLLPYSIGESGLRAFAAGCVGGLVAASVSAAFLSRSLQYDKLLAQSGIFFAAALLALSSLFLVRGDHVSPLSLAGVVVLVAGVAWLYVTSSQVRHAWRRPVAGREAFGLVLRSGFLSSVFGFATLFGLYTINAAAGLLASDSGRAVIAMGLQMLAVVIFVPGALSAYMVPKLQAESSTTAARRLMLRLVAGYTVMSALTAGVCVGLLPALARLWRLSLSAEAQIGFALLMLAAVLAAANAAFNQLFVSERAFGLQAVLACMWLSVVLLVTRLGEMTVATPGLALIAAYLVTLLLAAAALARGCVRPAGLGNR